MTYVNLRGSRGLNADLLEVRSQRFLISIMRGGKREASVFTRTQIEEWRVQRAAIASDLEDYESGRLKWLKENGRDWVDVSPRAIEHNTSVLATYDKMIALAEKIVCRDHHLEGDQ